MITSMHIENFKCFKDFDIELGPFNVLVGPNDSGKTAFMQAVRIATGNQKKPRLSMSELGNSLKIVLGRETFWRLDSSRTIKIFTYGPSKRNEEFPEWLSVESEGASILKFGRYANTNVGVEDYRPAGESSFVKFAEKIGTVACYRFDPVSLKHPSPVLQTRMEESGLGLPTFLDDINRNDRPAFSQLEAEFCKRFPYYKGIQIDKTAITYSNFDSKTFEEKDSFVLGFKTAYGKTLSAKVVSDGVMLSLGLLALNYASHPPRILLIEEPENGVHYASLKDIVGTLQDLSKKKDVQIILTTHSPYLLDLVEPDEVNVFWKDEKTGAVDTVKLSAHPEVEDLKKHFMTGEIWTTFQESEIVAKAQGGKG